MAAGLQITRAGLDSISGSLALDFRNWVARVNALQRGVGGMSDAEVIALPNGGTPYTQAEVNALRAAIGNMIKIKGVATGTAVQATATDLTAAMEALTGIQ